MRTRGTTIIVACLFAVYGILIFTQPALILTLALLPTLAVAVILILRELRSSPRKQRELMGAKRPRAP
jgi:hypothetical protein